MSSNWSGLRQDEWVSREFSVKWEFVDWCPLSFPFLEAQMTCPQQNHGPKCSSPSYKISPFSFISSWQSYQQSQQIKSRLKQQYLFFFSSRVANFFFLSSLCCTLPKRYALSTSVESAGRAGCAESFYRSAVKWVKRKWTELLQKRGQTADGGGFTSTLTHTTSNSKIYTVMILKNLLRLSVICIIITLHGGSHMTALWIAEKKISDPLLLTLFLFRNTGFKTKFWELI